MRAALDMVANVEAMTSKFNNFTPSPSLPRLRWLSSSCLNRAGRRVDVVGNCNFVLTMVRHQVIKGQQNYSGDEDEGNIIVNIKRHCIGIKAGRWRFLLRRAMTHEQLSINYVTDKLGDQMQSATYHLKNLKVAEMFIDLDKASTLLANYSGKETRERIRVENTTPL